MGRELSLALKRRAGARIKDVTSSVAPRHCAARSWHISMIRSTREMLILPSGGHSRSWATETAMSQGGVGRRYARLAQGTGKSFGFRWN